MNDRVDKFGEEAWHSEADAEAAYWLGQEKEYAEFICGSEIEKLLYVTYAMMLRGRAIFCHGEGIIRLNSFNVDDSATLLGEQSAVVAFIPQYKILNYRADFVARRYERRNGPLGNIVVPSEKYVIECDGHDFHERTADQATRDKSRDRDLQAKGYFVLRFTGREVWADPIGCAREIDDQLTNSVEECEQKIVEAARMVETS